VIVAVCEWLDQRGERLLIWEQTFVLRKPIQENSIAERFRDCPGTRWNVNIAGISDTA